MKRTLMTLGLAMAVAMPTWADAIFVSNAGDDYEVLAGTSIVGSPGNPGLTEGDISGETGGAVVITPNPVWKNPASLANNPSWISIRPFTGVNPTQIVTPNSGVDPRVSFSETFTLTSATVESFTLTVYADDTTAVFLNDVEIFPNNPVNDGACADGQIGCTFNPDEGITFSLSGLNPGQLATISSALNVGGSNTLRFDVHQQGASSFGLLYSGSVDQADVVIPEPSTWAMLGSGLVALAYSRRRRS